MHWEQVGMGLRRAMKQAGLGGALVTGLLLLGLPADAGEFFYASRSHAGGLTSESSWQQIIKTPGVYAESPFLLLWKSFISAGALCAEGELLRIADPRADNGVRGRCDRRPGRGSDKPERNTAPCAPTCSAPPATFPPAATGGDSVDGPSVLGHRIPSRQPVGPTVERVFLFAKAWEIPPCTTR